MAEKSTNTGDREVPEVWTWQGKERKVPDYVVSYSLFKDWQREVMKKEPAAAKAKAAKAKPKATMPKSKGKRGFAAWLRERLLKPTTLPGWSKRVNIKDK